MDEWPVAQEPTFEFENYFDESELRSDRLKGGSSSYVFLSLFLALYLLLLAVFILLNSISVIDKKKSDAVVDSVRNVFRNSGGVAVIQGTSSSDASDAERTRVFLKEIETAFSERIEVVSIKFTPRGDRMKITAATGKFYRDGQTKINPDIEPILNRIADSLARRDSDGLRYEIALMVGAGGSLPSGTDLSKDFELRRAGQFANTLRSMGVPPDSIRVGVRAANPELIEIHFFVRRKSQARISFDQLLEAGQ